MIILRNRERNDSYPKGEKGLLYRTREESKGGEVGSSLGEWSHEEHVEKKNTSVFDLFYT